MVKLYYKLVKAGIRTITDVPEYDKNGNPIRSEVQALLDAE